MKLGWNKEQGLKKKFDMSTHANSKFWNIIILYSQKYIIILFLSLIISINA